MSSDTVSASPALAVEELVAGYGGVTALDGVSISAGTGAITAVLGANGAGKTTLLRAVSGMIRPRRGRIVLTGTDLAAEGSLVVVEHPLDLMMSVCDSLVVLDFGKVIATGTPREVQDNPAVTAAYLGTAHE